MNAKKIVRLSNIIGIISILLLVYWVFTFITIEVFGLKVFRKNMTETFYLSVLGILALMSGSLIVNIMFNLTRIAEKDKEEVLQKKAGKFRIVAMVLGFPIILVVLFGGNYLTSIKKEKMLVESAKSILEANKTNSDKLLDYNFSKKYINETANVLEILSKTDKNFPNVVVLVKDTIKETPVFLGFQAYQSIHSNDTIKPAKTGYLYETTKEEREYLNSIFDKNSNELRYSSYDGNYELFYPYKKNGKRIVLYFSEQQRYGKLGS
ncbi:peptidase [Flavobacterium anhuiense]|uniref:Peptidase n=1 Tax=Flavobacterium anhuiense TaxID=459526 RepID=A0A444VX07_9FLAO|nr:peptidase [Flavobacterium anhuiense]RYJ38120.1 peptidase [Flavobacterium anhuiense]